MKLAEWHRLLDSMTEQIVEPICPPGCCFTQICPELRQRGINQLFVDGSYRERGDCLWFQQYAPFARGTLGTEPPATAEEFFELVCERRAITEEAS